MKIYSIIGLINQYYKQAKLSLISLGKSSDEFNSVELLTLAEEFDIKDEDLFSKFENFLKAYKEFLELINFDISNLANEDFGELTELASTLERRYNKIQTLPYLSLAEDREFDEDFNVDDFRNLLNKMMDDVRSKIKSASGLEISDAAAQQLAVEFNDQRIDRGSFNSGLRMTGNIIQQKLAAVRKYFQNLKFNYEKYQAYKARARDYAKKFKEQNPEMYKALIEKSSQRKKIKNNKRLELLKLLDQTTDPKIKKELEKELINLELSSKRYIKKDYEGKEIENVLTIDQALENAKVLEKQRLINQRSSNINKKERKEAGGIIGSLENLNAKVSDIKGYAKKKAIKKVTTNPSVKKIKSDLNELGEKIKSTPSMELINLQRKLQEQDALLIVELLNKDPEIISAKELANNVLEFRDKVSESFKSGWINEFALPEQKEFVKNLINDGLLIADTYIKFDALNKTLLVLVGEMQLSLGNKNE